MFFVFNKSKIYSYLVSMGTVMLLLVMGFYITNNNETMQTSANEISSYIIENNYKDNAVNTVNKENIENNYKK